MNRYIGSLFLVDEPVPKIHSWIVVPIVSAHITVAPIDSSLYLIRCIEDPVVLISSHKITYLPLKKSVSKDSTARPSPPRCFGIAYCSIRIWS